VQYDPLFDPTKRGEFRATSLSPRRGDGRDGQNYVATDEINLAVNVALATSRPLLVEGPPGCGKSSLAKFAAEVLGWRYLEFVVTSNTEAQDLQWHFDALQRLNDATANQLKDVKEYVKPGVLWEAFNPTSAAQYGPRKGRESEAQTDRSGRAVVLIDEIDKADPDVPNNLLVTLGSMQFDFRETGETIRGELPPLVIITSNNERDLPIAFVRRCVLLQLESPKPDRLKVIGRKHFPEAKDELLSTIAERLDELQKQATSLNVRPPSTAEFLDALQACLELKVKPQSEHWIAITKATMWKHSEGPSRTT
jgi:MoxR-like ATPase